MMALVYFDKEIATRLVIALVLSGLLGINRELRGKPAGFRTHALVCLGAAAATLAALSVGDGISHDANASSRVVQGILTGIGFIGAGVILRDPEGHVSGLTTATTIWMSAVIGFVAALGTWPVLLPAFVLTVLALLFGRGFERLIVRIFARSRSNGADATRK